MEAERGNQPRLDGVVRGDGAQAEDELGEGGANHRRQEEVARQEEGAEVRDGGGGGDGRLRTGRRAGGMREERRVGGRRAALRVASDGRGPAARGRTSAVSTAALCVA